MGSADLAGDFQGGEVMDITLHGIKKIWIEEAHRPTPAAAHSCAACRHSER